MRRVVVTGMGMVTPVGRDLETTWSALLEGKSGVGPITLFDSQTFPTRIAAEVRDFRLEDYHARMPSSMGRALAEHPLRTRRRPDGRVDDSGILNAGSTVDRNHFGVYLGAGEGQHDFLRFVKTVAQTTHNGTVNTAEFTRLGVQKLSCIKEAEQEPGTPAGHLASAFGLKGPNSNCLTACAASSQAIGEAFELIRRGYADVMLSGGTHSMIHPFGVTGFILLTALSQRNDEPTRASRPFDNEREGFILGEGAGMVILEELEHAKARGAKIHGEVIGYGSTADAFRITDSHDEGRGAIACIKEALASDAELDPSAHRLHQRPRHQHLRQRLDRDAGHQAVLRRAGLRGPHLQHQEHDGGTLIAAGPGASRRSSVCWRSATA